MSFRRIKGQARQIRMLKAVWANDRLAPAYLFSGAQGIGKSLAAQEFIKLINCLDRKDDDACDACISCVKIDKDNHPDAHWLPLCRGVSEDEAENIRIEDIRQLRKDISLRPYEARFKTFVIDRAQRMTIEAANALLKVLEEPPPHSLIILITSQAQLLPKTIVSRCQHLKFAALEKDTLKEMLNKEHGLNDTLSHYLAYYCEGRLGKALRLKGTHVLADKNRIIDYFTSPRSQLADLEANKEKLREILAVAISWFRDIYFVKAGLSPSQLINIDRKNDLINSADRYSFTQLNSVFRFIPQAALYLEQNANQKLLLNILRIVLGAKQ